MKPESLVRTDLPAAFQFHDCPRPFAQETSDKVVVVDFSQKTDSLAVLAAGTRQPCRQSRLAHLLLHQSPQRKQKPGYLKVVNLSQKIRLILHRIFGRCQPHLPFAFAGRRIVPRRNPVVRMSRLFLETAELDQLVTHHVRVGREALSHLVDGVSHHPVPVLLLEIHHLQLQAILAGRCRRQFDVLFRRAAQSVVGIHADPDIKQVGLVALFAEQVDRYGTVHSARNQCSQIHEVFLRQS